MTTPEEIQERAGALIGHAAGYVAHRAIAMGLQHGLFESLAGRDDGLTVDELAEDAGIDPFYAGVWLRAAYGAGILDHTGERFTIDPATATLLLDDEHPGFVGALFTTLEQPEIFDEFSKRLPSGERLWWDEVRPEFIQAVSATGRPFYNRLIGAALDEVPSVAGTLAAGATVLELACGAGVGLVKLAHAYPEVRLVGVDGDAHSLDRAAKRVADEGLAERVDLAQSMFEDFRRDDTFDVAIISISMHECRDLDAVTANVFASLKPGGVFVISDFPFPDDLDGLRTPPARVMSGIQFFEALIDDQLMATAEFVELLERHGFEGVGSFDVTPVHAITYGRRPEA